MSKNQSVTEISLVEFCGEFCTERKNEGILELAKKISTLKANSNEIRILRKDVKIMSASFVDELVKLLLSLQVGRKFIETQLSFNPQLETIYSDQIQRSLASRN